MNENKDLNNIPELTTKEILEPILLILLVIVGIFIMVWFDVESAEKDNLRDENIELWQK